MNEVKPTPPSSALRFLAWFCPPALHESIEGDLMQQFETDVKLNGSSIARRRFAWNVIKFFRPEIFLRNKFTIQLINTIMIGNYIKVAGRNMAKRKLYSFINAFGLSIGIAFCILIYLYIVDEKSFDQFHVNKDLIYRVEERSYDTWEQDAKNPYNSSAYLPLPLLNAIKTELPEVKYGAHFAGGAGALQYGDKVFTENFSYTESDFFKMFSFRLLRGSSERIFQTKEEVVLTSTLAKKYFGDEDPIGKSMSLFIGQPINLTVTGIVEDPPANSSLPFTMLVPMELHPHFEGNMARWGNFGYPTFIQLHEKADPSQLGPKFDALLTKYMGDRIERWRKEANVPANIKMLELPMTSLSDIHMKKEIGWHKVSDEQYSLILGGIAVLILVIACINYISLALTTSTSRRVEVGIRKVVGAQRNQLVYQFGFESIILALCSMVLAIGLVILFLPYFNDFTGKSITLPLITVLQIVGIGLALSVIVGMLAGSYPSFFLSRFKPVSVLKGGFTSRLQAGFTKPLVVLQFAMSAFLIISSVIMFRQMDYVTTKDLGYDKDQVIAVPTHAGWSEKSDKVVEQFRARLATEPSVISVAGTTDSFNKGYSRYGFKINDEQRSAYVYAADHHYIPTLGLKLVMGRNFDPQKATDTTALIVNEAMVKYMGWKDPLNEYLNWREDSVGPGYKIIGVVKDYHFLSLEKGIEPLFLSMDRKEVGHLMTMMIKLEAGNIPSAIERIRSAWKELYPDKPFDYSFVEEDVARQYDQYRKWTNIMGLSTAFAIVIACLGLFGLSGINAVNKTKEIGIRKVMGAELGNIFMLLNRQYIFLALIAFAIATPLSWYVMTKWLNDFQFKVELGWGLFAISMFVGILIALVTVSYHTIKAGSLNPAQTLKYE